MVLSICCGCVSVVVLNFGNLVKREVVMVENPGAAVGMSWEDYVTLVVIMLSLVGMLSILLVVVVRMMMDVWYVSPHEGAMMNEGYGVWLRLVHTNETWSQPRVGFESRRMGLFVNLDRPERDEMKMWVRGNLRKLGKGFPVYAYGELYR